MSPLFRSFRLTALAAAVLGAPAAMASGYNFGTQSVTAQSTANANGAEANDASVIYSNPAGMSRLSGTQFSLIANVVLPELEFKERGTTTNGLGLPVDSDNGGDPVKTTFVPHFYLTHQLSPRVVAGLGLYVPFGAKVEYDNGFAGRYYATKTAVEMLNINPSLSFKFDEHQSFGIGLVAQYAKGALARQVSAAQTMYGIGTELGLPAGTVQALAVGALGVEDLRFHIQGDSWGLGYNLGYFYELNPHTRFGLAYRSEIKQKLAGDAMLQNSAPLATYIASGPLAPYANAIFASFPTTARGHLNVTAPQSASLNAYHEVNARLALMGDVTWTGHSSLQHLTVEAQPITTTYIKTDWDDTWKASVGASYMMTAAWKLRGGYMYDQSPVTDRTEVLPTLPDNDRQWLSLGTTWQMSKRSSIDVAYSYVFIQNQSIDRSYDYEGHPNSTAAGEPETQGHVAGSFKSHLQIIGLQWNYAF